MNKVHLQLALVTACLAYSMSAMSMFPAATEFAPGESSIVKAAGGVTAVFPDMCKTPSPAGPVPIPYPNVVRSSTEKGPEKVKLDGQPVATKDSKYQMSSGDEAGSAQGVASGKIKGKAEFMLYSFDVKVEGKVVIRQSGIMLHNASNANMPPGQQVAPSQVTVRAATPNGAGSSVTEVSYIDASGREFKLRESTLIALKNGEYCAVCMARGRVTAIHRLISASPKRKNRRTNNR